jgi:DnaK suppressor protein
MKTRLLSMRSHLLAQIAEQRGGTKSRAEVAAEHFAHSEDATAQVNTARDLEFALNEHETAELAAIDDALQRLSTGTYGQCTDCGATISEARLNVAPEAARCMTCQEKFERHHA